MSETGLFKSLIGSFGLRQPVLIGDFLQVLRLAGMPLEAKPNGRHVVLLIQIFGQRIDAGSIASDAVNQDNSLG
jgi:hypothetical protein